MITARSKNAEGEKEEREHFGEHRNGGVLGFRGEREDSIRVELLVLSRGSPEGSAKDGPDRSPDDFEVVIVSPRNCLPSGDFEEWSVYIVFKLHLQ